MTKPTDPATLMAESKRTDSLLRDARSVLRRTDTLAATARATGDGSLPLIAEVRTAAERLVSHLMHRRQSEQRGVKQAARRLR